jgi:hypothetical protein
MLIQRDSFLYDSVCAYVLKECLLSVRLYVVDVC